MRISVRVFTIVLPAVIILFFWVGAPVGVQAESARMAINTELATNVDLLRASPAPDNPATVDALEPTRTPRPTPTPIPIPPPSNPNTTQMMVIFGIMVVLVVIFGLWLNRNRMF
jgi:hypothetical protein